MAGNGNGNGDAKAFVSWLRQKATSHPIDQIVNTLKTGKPQVKKVNLPAPANPQSAPATKFRTYGPAAPASRMKSALAKNGMGG